MTKKLKLLLSIGLPAIPIAASLGLVTYVAQTNQSASSSSVSSVPNDGSISEADLTANDNAPTKTITPQIATDFTYIGSFSDLFTADNKIQNVGNVISQKVQASEQLKAHLITNYVDFNRAQKDSLNIVVTTPNDVSWGGTKAYADWKPQDSANIVYYAAKSPKISVASAAALKTYLQATQLKQIMVDAGRITADSSNNYAIVNDDKAELDTHKDYLDVSVQETSGATTTNLDLRIPVSDIQLVFSGQNAKVSVRSSEESTLVSAATADLNTLSYSVGIDSNVYLDPAFNRSVILDNLDMSPMNIASSLGLTTNSNSTQVINDERIAELTQVFNATFTWPVTLYDSKNTTLYFSATPDSGYTWTDGSTSIKLIEFDSLKVSPGFLSTQNIPSFISGQVNYPTLNDFKNNWNSNGVKRLRDNQIKSQLNSHNSNDYPNNIGLSYLGDDSIVVNNNHPVVFYKISNSPNEILTNFNLAITLTTVTITNS